MWCTSRNQKRLNDFGWGFEACEVFLGNICLTTKTALIHTIRHGTGAWPMRRHRSVEVASCSVTHQWPNWQNEPPDTDVWLCQSTSYYVQVCHHHPSPVTPFTRVTTWVLDEYDEKWICLITDFHNFISFCQYLSFSVCSIAVVETQDALQVPLKCFVAMLLNLLSVQTKVSNLFVLLI